MVWLEGLQPEGQALLQPVYCFCLLFVCQLASATLKVLSNPQVRRLQMSLCLTPHECTQFSTLQVLSNPTSEAADVWLRDCRQSFSIMIREKQTRDAAAAKKEVSMSSPVMSLGFAEGLRIVCSWHLPGAS